MESSLILSSGTGGIDGGIIAFSRNCRKADCIRSLIYEYSVVMKFTWVKGLTLGGILAARLTAQVSEITKVSHPTSEWIQRADLYFRQTAVEPKGWLLLCPGRNGNGEGLLNEAKWLAFAKQHHLLMCGVSFASSRKDDLLGRYTEVQKGSGELILKTMDQQAGKELPMLVVGFSAGARFTTNWIAWKPERVIAWSAQAVGNWPEPVASKVSPPGIIASGEYDAGSWFASLQYFQAARKLGKNVIWVSLEKLGHARSPVLDGFTREFFSYCLNHKGLANDHWNDIDSKRSLSPDEVNADPIFATWLPSEAMAKLWQIIHHP